MTKISETLTEIKQVESELLRKINIRDEIIKREFKLKSWEEEKKKPAELEKLEKNFVKDKKNRIGQITVEINKLKNDLIEKKSIVNKKNIELGIDKKILAVKWARIELAQLMKFLKKEDYGFSSTKIEELEETGVMDLIKELETKKHKIDSEIQNVNFRETL